MVASPSLLALRDLPVTAAAVSPKDDAARQAALVRTHLPSVWRFLRRLGLQPDDADDVAQEVFLIAVRKTDVIEEGHERSFLFGIALRIALRARRTQKTRAERTETDVEIDQVRSPDPSSDELCARKEARVLLDKALSEMKPDVRTAFVLYELEQMTMIEIATLTESAPGTVASRIRRGREQFQSAAARFQARMR
ncbi:MAG: RNA polymerase sigma factor [Labilithrix sp.]|nr:RNA polymerase sigma factor [Labilithrix sp.]MBX3225562.1 RNA polymerase sigma factor [Labilithrix sp.]